MSDELQTTCFGEMDESRNKNLEMLSGMESFRNKILCDALLMPWE